MQREPGLKSKDRVLAITPISFDISVLELFLPLITGAQTVILNNHDSKDSKILLDAVRVNGISVMQATPSTWQMIFDAGWNGEGVKKILCGGEALPRELAEKFYTTKKEVWNLYGPTETTVWSTCYKLSKAIREYLLVNQLQIHKYIF